MASLPRLVLDDTPNKSTPRPLRVRLIVVHTAEGGYKGTVSFLKRTSAQASSTLVLREDGLEATQLVGYDEKPWTQRDFNGMSESIEAAGFLEPDKAKGQVGHSFAQMRSLARIVAFRLRRNDLPCHYVLPSERFTHKGYTRHGDLAPEGGHPFCLLWQGAKWTAFRSLVRWEFMRGGFRKTWGLSFT